MTETLQKQYFDIKFKDNAHYNLFTFCARGARLGNFSIYKSDYEDNLNRFMFNCQKRGWYINEIEGFSENFEDTVTKLKNLINQSGYKKSLFIGSSMGAYGAIILGTMCQAQRVIGFGAEIITNLPGSHSKDDLSYLEKDLNFYNLKDIICASPTQIDLFVGEGSPIDIFCAFYMQKYCNVNIHLIKNADHTVVNHLKNKNLLRDIVNSGITGLRLTLPKEIYASDAIYAYLCTQKYEPDAELFKKFALDYIHFYIEHKENISLENYIHLYEFLFRLKFFNEAVALLDICRIRFGKLQDFDYKQVQIFYQQKEYERIIDAKYLDNHPEFYYMKALAYHKSYDKQNFLKTIEDGLKIADFYQRKDVFKRIDSLRNYIKN